MEIKMKILVQTLQSRIVRIVAFPSFCYHLFFSIKEAFANFRFALHFIGKVRRFWLVHYRKDFVRNQLVSRQGSCRQCSTCCSLLFTCPMLTNDGGCLTYGTCRPQACKVFPIDQRDIDEVRIAGGKCGYRFTEPYLEENTGTEG